VPVIGTISIGTSTLFDIGVYLVVVGLVLDILRSLGGEVDRQEEQSEEAGTDLGGGIDDLEQGEGPEIAERPEHLDAELETPLTGTDAQEEARR
jgi:multicomponent Na+:H+ antiporter subunit A